MHLVQLVGVVEGHLLDAVRGRVADVRARLARLRVDDAGRVDAQLQDLVDLGLGGAVEARAERGQEPEDLGVRVALDGWGVGQWCGSGWSGCTWCRRTIVRLDPLEVHLPAEVLAVDLAHVGDEEGILLAGLAGISVNALHARLHSIVDQLLGVRTVEAMMISLDHSFLSFIDRDVLLRDFDGRRCHAHANRVCRC